MTHSELNQIESKLQIKLPEFYTHTMLNYPFESDSFTAEFSLCNDINGIIANNEVFEADERKFAVGSDGGELIFYIYLDGDDKVYIYDFEHSHIHDSLESDNWGDYLKSLNQDEEEMNLDEQLRLQKRKTQKMVGVLEITKYIQ